MTRYLKQALTFQAQLQQLQSRGLGIADLDTANRYLQRVGYYRLMGYLYPQRMPGSDQFLRGATFEEAVSLYEFDRGLRDLVMEAVGHIEVATRTLLTYHFSHAYGPFGHLDPRNFSFSPADHRTWVDGISKEISRSKETFIRHYQDTYSTPAFPLVPIWMATEVMSLGSLSRFYKALRAVEQKVIARDVEMAAPVLQNWLHVTSVARNVVAHHGRLWNKELGVSAARPRSAGWSEPEAPFPPGRVFFLLLLLRRLLKQTTADAVLWRDRVDTHLQKGLTTDRHISGLGATHAWQTHRLWRL